ncbi:MAG: MFS transporter [Candidatus Cloacimonetes bacterium]|nr:MFS transporter [Candidatus Cloacimonadota bacterium]
MKFRKPADLNRNVLGWIFYDFANSSFTTIIVTVIYAVYFKNVVVNSGEMGTALWGRAISISMLMVALAAPIMGAVADFSRAKKNFLFYFTVITVVFTALLYYVKPGDISRGFWFFIIANFGFNCANVFYNSLLPDITSRSSLGKVSGWGWSFGYLGGLVSLLLVYPLVNYNIRLVFPVVALFFSTFALITFIFLKGSLSRFSRRTNYFKIAFQRLYASVRSIRHFKELIKFLIAFMIYNDGIVVVISFASIYGATRFGMTTASLISFFVIMQISSFFGAFIFGYILDRIGARITISITLLLWIVVTLGAFFAASITAFYVVGLVAGLAIGSSQSSSRTMLALLTPPAKMAEFYGFYSFTGKVSSVIGPLIYGEIARITGSQRFSILAITVFFITGLVVLYFVDEKKGLTAAGNWIDT